MNRSIRTLAALSLFSLLSLEALPPKPLQNYCPVVLVNNTGLPDSDIYFISHGNDNNGIPCFLVPSTSTGVCNFVYPTPSGTPSSAGSSVTLSQLPAATGTGISDPAYLIYLPINSSSRGYFSLKKPMYLATAIDPALGVLDINDSSVTSLTDPNFYTLYQDFEFGLVNSLTNSSTQIFLNLSWVDYFCLPMQLTTRQYSSIPPNQEVIIDPTALPAGTISSLTRENIISNVNTGLTNQGSPWPTLGVKYLANPYTDTTSNDYVRILAMKNSIDLGGTTGKIPFSGGTGYVAQDCFPSDYFSSTTAGPLPSNSYMQEVYDHYSSDTLWVQIFPAHLPAATYSISSDTSGSGATNLTLNFTGQGGAPSTTIQLANLTAEKFLSGSVWPFTPVIDAAYSNELSKVVSALFTIGKFPMVPNSTTSSSPFVNNNGGFAAFTYFSNPITGWSGTWYNLYCELLHKEMISTGYVPSNPNLGLGYAYDYDDLLNMSGIINGLTIQNNYGNPSQTSGALEPYIVITLESLSGTNIPDISQDQYTISDVTVGPAANGVQVSFSHYNGSTTFTTPASATGNTDLGKVVVDSSHPFQVTFSFDAAPDYPAPTTYTFDINLLRQVVTPTTNTSSFSTIDQYFQGSITFENTGTNTDPKLLIQFNSTPPGWPG